MNMTMKMRLGLYLTRLITMRLDQGRHYLLKGYVLILLLIIFSTTRECSRCGFL
jgi:hypothetical protein